MPSATPFEAVPIPPAAPPDSTARLDELERTHAALLKLLMLAAICTMLRFFGFRVRPRRTTRAVPSRLASTVKPRRSATTRRRRPLRFIDAAYFTDALQAITEDLGLSAAAPPEAPIVAPEAPAPATPPAPPCSIGVTSILNPPPARPVAQPAARRRPDPPLPKNSVPAHPPSHAQNVPIPQRNGGR